MSQLRTNSITNISNTGDANISLGVDGSTTIPAPVVNQLNSGPLSGFRNHIINGSMNVIQRGGGQFSGAAGYTLDRWYRTAAGADVQRDFNEFPEGFSRSMKVFSGAVCQVAQAIELNDTAQKAPFTAGDVYTYSFYAKTASGREDMFVQTAFADDVAFLNGTGTDQSASQQIDNTWKRYSYQVTIPADAIGAANNCFVVSIRSSVGLTSDIFITGVQLEPGPVATPFEHRTLATELALCQRYYVALGGVYGLCATPSSSSQRIGQMTFPVTMRTTPEVTGTTAYSPSYAETTAVALSFTTTGVSSSSNHLVQNVTADAEL